MTSSTGLPSDWERAIICLYYETDDGALHGLGNAAVIAANGSMAIAVTAAHNAAFLSNLAARDSPFRNLQTARAANPAFRSRVRKVIGDRRCDGESDVVDVPTFRPPVGEDSDVALAILAKRDSSPHPLASGFGLKLVRPALGETVYIAGSHSHELADVQELEHGRRWNFRTTIVGIPARVTAHFGSAPLSPGPLFEVDASLPSGLSGSPVICVRDQQALVCGIVSSSGLGSDRGSVAAIWPVLGLTVKARSDFAPSADEMTIAHLARNGSVRVYGDELDAFAFHDDGTFGPRR